MRAEIKPRINFEGRTKLETVIPLSTPYLVFLDPSDICNQRCPMCPSGNRKLLKGEKRKPQLMNFSLYKKIIDDLANMPEPVKTLRLYKDGEPLLNPRFPDMVEFAKETGRFGQIDTTTNGKILSYSLIRDIVKAGLDKIFISVPAGYPKKLVDMVGYLFQHSMGSCEVYVKTIGDGLSDEQKAQFYSDFGNISDRIFIENLAPCWPGYNVGTVGKRGIYNQEITREAKVCPYIFYSSAINSNGLVSLCFLDWRHKMIIGDLNTESFKDIWGSSLLRDAQKAHLTGGRVDMKYCCECGQLKYGAPDFIDPYAEDILRRIL